PPSSSPIKTAVGLGTTGNAPVSKAANDDDIDWDDEDEKTAIFDKHSSADLFGAGRKPLPAAGAPPALPSAPPSVPSLPRSSLSTPMPLAPPGVPRSVPSVPPPPPAVGRITSSMPVQVPPPAARLTPSLPPMQQPRLPSPMIGRGPDGRTISSVVPAGKVGNSKFAWIAGIVLVVGVALFVLMLLMPKSGNIVVAVAGSGNKAMDAVQIAVDGAKQCDSSPCVIKGVKAGSHIVKATASGFNPSTQTVTVSSGDEVVLNLQLSSAGEGTGVRVTAEGAGLKLWIDDKEIGPLPQEVKDLTPGEHKIRVAGNDRFAPYEETISLSADQIKSVGPLELKVVRGLAMIEPGENSDGAKVLLVNGAEKRQIPKLPYRVEISTDKHYQLVASKKGFPTATIPVTFEPGKDQKRFVIDLRADAAAPAAEAVPEEPSHSSAGTAVASHTAARNKIASAIGVTPAAPPPAAAKAAPAAAGQGTLNINSIPQSNVLLDGRPLGKTPKAGVTATAGQHRVTFIHPEHGRKETAVNVVAGKTATAAVRFP
ncbi:MAG TPA: PEGA domain-containing protein, partial [Polyangiaceae bacterium]|nr:PEGA domain-containing protein [Polyangiaceae bacterium]